jgi:hypothetical protein
MPDENVIYGVPIVKTYFCSAVDLSTGYVDGSL